MDTERQQHLQGEGGGRSTCSVYTPPSPRPIWNCSYEPHDSTTRRQKMIGAKGEAGDDERSRAVVRGSGAPPPTMQTGAVGTAAAFALVFACVVVLV